MKLLIISLLILFLYSCDKFEYNQYQVSPKEGHSKINKKNINRLSNQYKDTIRIAVIGDSQRFYTSTLKVIENINSRNDLDFVIHTGDLVDFGLQREFTAMHNLLSKITIPYMAVIGNHDMIANGPKIYREMYGEDNFSFYFQGFKFIYLNTNGMERQFDHSLPNINWLESELTDTSLFKNAFVINHVPPGHVDFDNSLEDEYRSILNASGKVLISINGHNHNYAFLQSSSNVVAYLNSYSTTVEKYIVVTIWKDNFELEHVTVN